MARNVCEPTSLQSDPFLEGAIHDGDVGEKLAAIERGGAAQSLDIVGRGESSEGDDVDFDAGQIEAHPFVVGGEDKGACRPEVLAQGDKSLPQTALSLNRAAVAPQ